MVSDAFGWVGRRRFTAIALSLGLLAGACQTDAQTRADAPSAAGDGRATPSRTRPTLSSATPARGRDEGPAHAGSPSAPVLEDGRHLVYLRAVETGSTPAVIFDLTEWYTGQAAIDEAIERGDLDPGDPLPNDYYIVNDNPLLRTMAVEPTATIDVIDWRHCCDRFAGDLAALSRGIAAGKHNDGNYRSTSPYWLRVRDGRIVSIDEQYLP